MGKKRLIAEDRRRTAWRCNGYRAALVGLACEIYMGSEDIARQSLNVFRMKLLGAIVA